MYVAKCQDRPLKSPRRESPTVTCNHIPATRHISESSLTWRDQPRQSARPWAEYEKRCTAGKFWSGLAGPARPRHGHELSDEEIAAAEQAGQAVAVLESRYLVRMLAAGRITFRGLLETRWLPGLRGRARSGGSVVGFFPT